MAPLPAILHSTAVTVAGQCQAATFAQLPSRSSNYIFSVIHFPCWRLSLEKQSLEKERSKCDNYGEQKLMPNEAATMAYLLQVYQGILAVDT